MPRNNLKVEVNEVKESGGRKIVITILAPEEEFILGDLLAQRKKIPLCAAALKDAAIEGIKSWWESAEQVVAGAGNEQTSAEEDVAETRAQVEGCEPARRGCESTSKAGTGQRRHCNDVGIRELKP